jgi:hypothetical protein
MNMPVFSAEASLYKSSTHYGFASAWAMGTSIQVRLSQLEGSPAPRRTPIVCNGSCPPPICHFHCSPCAPNSNVPSGCGRTCCSFGPGCDDPGCDDIDCGAAACHPCPVTCVSTSCSCGTYPNCGATGMKTCTDCHGNPAPSQPC